MISRWEEAARTGEVARAMAVPIMNVRPGGPSRVYRVCAWGAVSEGLHCRVGWWFIVCGYCGRVLKASMAKKGHGVSLIKEKNLEDLAVLENSI